MRVNISSVQDFYQCRFRWWCKWVMNRVPIAESPALDAGKLLHRIFEQHFLGDDLTDAAGDQCHKYRKMIPQAHPAAQPGALKAVQQIEDLIEAFPLWEDKFPVDEVLGVEQPFEWADPVVRDLTWIGRPDRELVSGKRIWHEQTRGLAASTNFGTYIRLAKRHYHEHLYAEALTTKHRKRKLKYGGVIFNLVRKLKFRTNVGKKNESKKTAAEMFWQGTVAIDIKSAHHLAVMTAMRLHVKEMRQTLSNWKNSGLIPPPNEKMNGGFSGNSEDPFFKILIGEVKLNDDSVFKDREDQYANAFTEE